MSVITVGNGITKPFTQEIIWDPDLYAVKELEEGRVLLERKSNLDFEKLYTGALVRCVKKDDYDGTLIVGKEYEVTGVEYSGDIIGYHITDDSFPGRWYLNERTEHLFENVERETVI